MRQPSEIKDAPDQSYWSTITHFNVLFTALARYKVLQGLDVEYLNYSTNIKKLDTVIQR